VNTSVEYLAERLSPESFVRIHRSRIVNLEAVQAFERHDDKRVRARLTNGTTVVASRAWSSALRTKRLEPAAATAGTSDRTSWPAGRSCAS